MAVSHFTSNYPAQDQNIAANIKVTEMKQTINLAVYLKRGR